MKPCVKKIIMEIGGIIDDIAFEEREITSDEYRKVQQGLQTIYNRQ